MTKMGMSTQLAGADISALERGVIDATEFSMPNMDISLVYQIAKNNYYPAGTSRSQLVNYSLTKPFMIS